MQLSIKHLVIGSSGFIGNRLVRHLSREAEVKGLANQQEFNQFLDSRPVNEIETVYWVAGSLYPSSIFPSNVEQTTDFVNLRRFITIFRHAIKKFIFLSSGGCVYGPGPGHFDEQSPVFAMNKYGELKLISERLIWNELGNSIILRVSNVFGSEQRARRGQGVIPYWIENYKFHRKLEVYGPLEHYRDYIEVNSVVEAITKCSNLTESRILNIGSGQPISLQQILDVFAVVIGECPDIKLNPARQADRIGYTLDSTLAESVLNWKLEYSIIEKIQETISRAITD